MIYKLNGVEFNINQQQCINEVNWAAGDLLKNRDKWTDMGITEEESPIYNLTPEQVAANEASQVASNIQLLWQAAHDYEYAEINGTGVGLLVLGVLQSKAKALAVQAWCTAIWDLYYTRKLLVTSTLDAALLDFSSIGPMPHTIPELRTELGI